MDDDLKTTQTPVNQTQDVVAPTPTVQSAGNPIKEGEPLSSSENSSVSSSEQEMVISDELKEMGVEAVSERPVLTEEHAKVGIRVSEKPIESAPAPAPSPVNFKTPLTNEEMVLAPKRSIFDAIRWLAASISRQFKRALFNKQKQQTASGQI